MICFPNAKINIGLNITSRRSDGYHHLETLLYPVKINDALEIIEADKLSFEATGIEIPGFANENLCLRAYDLLKKDYDIPPVKIHLFKNIPIGAGLGGGSADAAFFIKTLNEKFELNLSTYQMQNYCRNLGTDCAFFIENKPVYAFAKGDEFEDIALDLSSYYLVLVMPPVHVSTGEAYRGVVPKQAEISLKDLIKLPVKEWQRNIKNDFEPHILKAHPSIRGVKKALLEAGAIFSLMSGSGASVYGIFENKPDLKNLKMENLVFEDI